LRVWRELRTGVHDCAVLEVFKAFNAPRSARHLRLYYEALDGCERNRGCTSHLWNIAENPLSDSFILSY